MGHLGILRPLSRYVNMKSSHKLVGALNGFISRGIAAGGKPPKDAKDFSPSFVVRNVCTITFVFRMFKRLHLLLAIVLLLGMMVLLIYPLRSMQGAFKYPFYVWPKQALALANINQVDLNETIFPYAAEDSWAEEEKKKVTLLNSHLSASLQFGLGSRAGRLETYGALLQRITPLRRSSEKSLLELSHPRYHPHWTGFRQAILSWSRNKKHEPKIMSDLLKLVKYPIDKHFSNSTEEVRSYKNCAIIGNSGILLDKAYGSLIDSHEVVVRLNNARTFGFEAYVGSKTTHSFINSNVLGFCARRPGCYCHPYGMDVPIIVYICQITHFMDVTLCSSLNRSPLVVTDPRFDTLCMRIAKYYSLKNFFEKTGRSITEWIRVHDGMMFHYSSGMQAVMLALGICERVDLFGFGKSSSAKHHYHTNQKGELNLHDYEAEYRFYDDLASNRTDSIPFLNQSGFKVPPVRIYL